MMLKPSTIYYSQDSVNNVFDSRCLHSNKRIGETLDDLCEGWISIYDIPTITVMQKNGKWFTGDNRRLWVFRHLERLGKCTTVPVNQVYFIPSNKFTTWNGGTSVSVRRNPGGRWYLKSAQTSTSEASSRPTSPYPVRSFSDYRLTGNSGSSSLTRSLFEPIGTVSRPASETISQSSLFSRSTNNYFGTKEQNVQRSFSSLTIQDSTDVKYVDPLECRFLKRHIKSTFDNAQSCDLLKLNLIHGLISYRSVAAIKVYEAYDQYYVQDGNRRLKAFRDARNIVTDIKIKSEVIGDEDDLLDEIRKEDPAITAFEVMQLGETVLLV